MSAIDEIVELARQQIELEQLVERAEAELSRLKWALKEIQTEALPLAMQEARLEKFTLDSGQSVSVKKDFTVGIPADRRPEAFGWLEAQGYGALIKTEVTSEFGKGELERARALVGKLMKQNYNCALRRDIHWQTLKAFVAESVRETRPIPLDLFGAIQFNKATIKAPSKPERKKS